MGETSTWKSESVTCFKDTTNPNNFVYIITSTDKSGDKLTLTLNSPTSGVFVFDGEDAFGNTAKLERSGSNAVYSSYSNDTNTDSLQLGGYMAITTPNFEDTSMFDGLIPDLDIILRKAGLDDDENFGSFSDVSFSNVPVTEGSIVDPEDPSGTGDGSVVCSIDEEEKEFPTINITNLGLISISASAADGSTLTFTFAPGATPGTYELGGELSFNSIAYTNSDNGFYSAASGTLEIESFDSDNGVYKGTFEFTGEDGFGSDPIAVTNGSFDIQ